jgi:hypothetical protein
MGSASSGGSPQFIKGGAGYAMDALQQYGLRFVTACASHADSCCADQEQMLL